MGAVAPETMEQYAKTPTPGVEPGECSTAANQLEQDVKTFINTPAEAINFLNKAKELYASGSKAEADVLVDRVITTMQHAFNEHTTECVGGH
jgi:hypothetical protein